MFHSSYCIYHIILLVLYCVYCCIIFIAVIWCNSDIVFAQNCEMFVTVYSSVKIPHRTSVYAVSHAGSSISSRRVAVLLDNQPRE